MAFRPCLLCWLLWGRRFSCWSWSSVDVRIKGRRKSTLWSSRRSRDEWESYNDWEEPVVNGGSRRNRYEEGEYDRYYDDNEEEETYQRKQQKDILEWESCSSDAGTAHVLLPPLSVEQPTAVIHFVGGTFFGSAPSLWYHAFLYDLVKHTQAAVIATSIPITVFQSSPLQHVTLARKLERQFHVAWRDVLIDEYGTAKMQGLPVCGVGHSLGSRLLVVLATLGGRRGEEDGAKRRRTYPWPPGFKALVTISFTNYGAASGIPGIYQLNRASRKLQREALNDRTKSRRKQQERRSYDYYEEDDDEDWAELFSDLSDVVKEQATKLKTALTPSSESLEFYPSPNQLWKALTMDQRYQVNNTLIVQFDDDEVDQSAKFANCLVNGTSAIYFSRIRGTHLTPVLPTTSQQKRRGSSEGWLERFNSRLGKGMAKLLTGRRRAQQNEESLLQLRQAVSSYIIEVVARDR